MDRKALHREVLERHQRGQSGWRISIETSVPISTVYGWIKNPARKVRNQSESHGRGSRYGSQELRHEVLRLFDLGLTGYQVSKQTGVPKSTVYYWRDHPTRGTRNATTCFRCLPNLFDPPPTAAYTYLLGQYLGDGHITTGPKTVVLSIACCDGWPGIMDEVEQVIRRVVTASVHRAHKIGCTAVASPSNHWLHLFPQHGPGMKHQRMITLDAWQRRLAEAHPEQLIRGLIHSDGCRVTNKVRRTLKDGDRWYEYPRYFFSNQSSDIHGILIAALDQLGIAWRFNRSNAISIAKRAAVARMDEFVGPKY